MWMCMCLVYLCVNVSGMCIWQRQWERVWVCVCVCACTCMSMQVWSVFLFFYLSVPVETFPQAMVVVFPEHSQLWPRYAAQPNQPSYSGICPSFCQQLLPTATCSFTILKKLVEELPECRHDCECHQGIGLAQYGLLTSWQLHRVTSGHRCSVSSVWAFNILTTAQSHQDTGVQLVQYGLLTSWQLHRVTSGHRCSVSSVWDFNILTTAQGHIRTQVFS